MSDLAGNPGAGRQWPRIKMDPNGMPRREQTIGVCPECGAANSLIYEPIREFTVPNGRLDWERGWHCCHCKARGKEHLIVELNYQAVHAHQDKFERCDE